MEGWKINPAPLLLGYYRSKFCSSARIFPRTALLADKSSSCSSRLRKAYVAANPSVFLHTWPGCGYAALRTLGYLCARA